MEINIISEEDFKPSTITLKAIFSVSVKIKNLSEFLPINNIFDENGKRRYLVSGSRESINYFGPEGSVVSMCYQKTRRGMRTGAMNNMVSTDIQYNHKNIHLKISAGSILSVGTSNLEDGKKVFETMIEHIINLQNNLEVINKISKEDKEKSINWIRKNCHENGKILRLKEFNEKIIDRSNFFIIFCSQYINDFDDMNKYIEKLENFYDEINIFSGELSCDNLNIYNSVYHISPIKQKNFRMPLHRLGPWMAEKGIGAEFHNWSSEGVNICFDIEEEKGDINHADKEYKHRFSTHETTKIRQCSPTNKKEAYKYYLGFMNLLKMFFMDPSVDYKKYIIESLDDKRNLEKLKLIKT
jgi:hypothetical protein